jgi:hypothetical protein
MVLDTILPLGVRRVCSQLVAENAGRTDPVASDALAGVGRGEVSAR